MNEMNYPFFEVGELDSTKQPWRVAMVSETYPPEVNGVARTLQQVVQGLLDRGHELQLVRPRQGKDERPASSPNFNEVLTKGLTIPMYRHLRMGLPSKRTLMKLWQDKRPALVHIATEGPLGWSALRAATELRLPVVSDFRTNFQAYAQYYGISWLQGSTMAYLRSFHNQCNQTMVPTEALLQQLSGNGFKRLKVVARGVDTLNFAPTKRSQGLREKWGVYGDDVAVLHVGRLAAEKNLGVLIRAYDKIRSVQPRARLVVVGDGPMRAELQAQFPQAYFAGFQSGEALAAHYASGDMFLFPSLTETYGNVTPEAMASGLGVVAFDDAAAGELIEHRSNGLLAPKTDSAAFVTLAAELARNATLRRQYGDQARSTVLAHGWSEIVRNVEDVYANAIKQSPFSLAHDIRSRLLPV